MSRPAFAGWLDHTNTVTQTFLSAGQIPGLRRRGSGRGLDERGLQPIAESPDIDRDHHLAIGSDRALDRSEGIAAITVPSRMIT